MDHVEIWDKAKALLREELANVSYTTWIDQPLKPVYVIDDKLALEVISEFTEKTIRARYLSMITGAVSEAAGREMTVELMSVKERIAWQESQKKEESRPLQGVNTFNPKSTFDTFVVGSSNRFAHAASLAVAEAPGMAYNPLFLYGGVGLGKTHLMHAIGHFIQDHFPNMRILYLPSEMFTNELVSAIQKNKNVEFRERFRNVDVLMIDDIQFIAGRDTTQEEFFNTFNALHSAGKQIIISSDRPPREIETLEDRLRSRFEWGLTVDIQQPDYETRMAILRKKEELEGYNIDNEVIKYIASNVKSNIRELEGALTKIVALSKLNNKEINIELAEEALKDLISPNAAKEVTPELIINVVSEHFGINSLDIIGQKRSKELVFPRQIVMYLCGEMTTESLQNIGKALGGRDHTTIIHGTKKISSELKTDENLKNTIDILKNKINPQ